MGMYVHNTQEVKGFSKIISTVCGTIQSFLLDTPVYPQRVNVNVTSVDILNLNPTDAACTIRRKPL